MWAIKYYDPYLHGFLLTLFSSRTVHFSMFFHVSHLIQKFQTNWFNSSTKSSLVIYNSCYTDYPVSCNIDSKLYGNDYESLYSSIDNNPDTGSHLDGIDNPSIHDTGNNSKDNHFFLPFITYVILTQTDGDPYHNNLLLWSQITAVDLFLQGIMDWMVMIRGWP